LFLSEIFGSTYGFFYEGRKKLFSEERNAKLTELALESTNSELKDLYTRLVAAGRGGRRDEIGGLAVLLQELYMAILLIWGGAPVALFDRDVTLTTVRTKRTGADHDELRQELFMKLDLSEFDRLETIASNQNITLGFWVLQFIESVGNLIFVMRQDCKCKDSMDLSVEFNDRNSDFLAAPVIDTTLSTLDALIRCVKKHDERAWAYIHETLAAVRQSVAAGLHMASLPLIYKKLCRVWWTIRSVEDNMTLIRAFDYAAVHNNSDSLVEMTKEKRRHRFLYSFYEDMRIQSFPGGVSSFFSLTHQVSNMRMDTVLFDEKRYLVINGGFCAVNLDNAELGSVIPSTLLDVHTISPQAHKMATETMHLYTLRRTFAQISDDALNKVCRYLATCELQNKGDSAICALFQAFRRLDADDEVPGNYKQIQNIIRDLDALYQVDTMDMSVATPELHLIHAAGLRLAKLIKDAPIYTLMPEQDGVGGSSEGGSGAGSAAAAGAGGSTVVTGTGGYGAAAGAGGYTVVTGAGKTGKAVKGKSVAVVSTSMSSGAGGQAPDPSDDAAGGNAMGKNTLARGPGVIILDTEHLSPHTAVMHVMTNSLQSNIPRYNPTASLGTRSFYMPIFGKAEEDAINNAVETLAVLRDSPSPKENSTGFVRIMSVYTFMMVRLKKKGNGFIVSYFGTNDFEFEQNNGLYYVPAEYMWDEFNAPIFEFEVQTTKR